MHTPLLFGLDLLDALRVHTESAVFFEVTTRRRQTTASYRALSQVNTSGQVLRIISQVGGVECSVLLELHKGLQEFVIGVVFQQVLDGIAIAGGISRFLCVMLDLVTLDSVQELLQLRAAARVELVVIVDLALFVSGFLKPSFKSQIAELIVQAIKQPLVPLGGATVAFSVDQKSLAFDKDDAVHQLVIDAMW